MPEQNDNKNLGEKIKEFALQGVPGIGSVINLFSKDKLDKNLNIPADLNAFKAGNEITNRRPGIWGYLTLLAYSLPVLIYVLSDKVKFSIVEFTLSQLHKKALKKGFPKILSNRIVLIQKHLDLIEDAYADYKDETKQIGKSRKNKELKALDKLEDLSEPSAS